MFRPEAGHIIIARKRRKYSAFLLAYTAEKLAEEGASYNKSGAENLQKREAFMQENRRENNCRRRIEIAQESYALSWKLLNCEK